MGRGGIELDFGEPPFRIFSSNAKRPNATVVETVCVKLVRLEQYLYWVGFAL